MTLVRFGAKVPAGRLVRAWKQGKRECSGILLNRNSSRLRTFCEKGLTCVFCGLKGTYFSKERHSGHLNYPFHFNLYAVLDGIEVLFTKDHIIPSSQGGSNKMVNLQTACSPCNRIKGENLMYPIRWHK